MKKYIFFLMGAVCFLLSSSAVHANELNKSDANIIGHVLDKNTEEHLSFISVSLKGTTIGTMTDASGHYFLKGIYILNYTKINREKSSMNHGLLLV